jgi:hypothetical protein
MMSSLTLSYPAPVLPFKGYWNLDPLTRSVLTLKILNWHFLVDSSCEQCAVYPQVYTNLEGGLFRGKIQCACFPVYTSLNL